MNKNYLLLAALILAAPAHAGVGKVSTPEVEKGVFEVEYNARRTGDDRRSLNNVQKHVTEVEYGFTDDWMVGLEFIANRSATSQLGMDAYGVETQYEMTQQSSWWLASALKAEYLLADDSRNADEGEFKLLLQRDEGPLRITANLELKREFGDNRDGGVGFETALRGLYRCNKRIAPGIEWHGEYGNLDNFDSPDRQRHYIGPVIKGELFELGEGEIGYEAGYFWGVTNASADNAQRVKISYEIAF